MKDEFLNIVDRANINNELKTVLKDVFQHLQRYNESTLNELKARTFREIDNLHADWNNQWNIITALIPTNALSNLSGFHKMIDKHHQSEELAHNLTPNLGPGLKPPIVISASHIVAHRAAEVKWRLGARVR